MMETLSADTFEPIYQAHLTHLKLKGLQPKTIDAHARDLRRNGKRFDGRIDSLTEEQLTDYYTELI
ncbi:MAG: recombinase, partial [Betaproteobacteria bacterium]